VGEIDKQAYQDCPSLCEAGCSVYASRPKACRDYLCLWIQGVFVEEDRPDRSGVIVDGAMSQEIADAIELVTGGLLPIVARRASRGAWSDRAKLIVEWLVNRVRLIVLLGEDEGYPQIEEVVAPSVAIQAAARSAISGALVQVEIPGGESDPRILWREVP